MALRYVEVGKPADALHAYVFHPVSVNTKTGRFEGIVGRYSKFPITAVNALAKPHPVSLDEIEYILVSSGIDVAKNYKAFPIFKQLCNILTEQRKGRISYHNIRLFQILRAFRATKVACAVLGIAQKRPAGVCVVPQQIFDISQVRRAVAIVINYLVDFDRVWFLAFGFQTFDVEEGQVASNYA